MRFVALYARVSSEHQVQGQTIDSQIAALRERAQSDGHRVTQDDVYADAGFSGSTLERPALERLRDRIADGRVDLLYVHSPDRLARRYAYQVLLLDEFNKRGVEVVFLQAPSQQNAEDALLVQVQGVVAEYERAKIMERSRRGRMHKAHGGVVNVLSCAPYGYRYVPKSDVTPARLEILPPEAKVVQRIFDAYVVEQRSIYDIARMLTAEQVPTRKHRARWDHATVCRILKNPAYAGRAAYGRTEVKPREQLLRLHKGQPLAPRAVNSSYRRKPPSEWITIAVPRIVSDENYAAAQQQLERNRRLRHAPVVGHYLLAGLVQCAQCHYAFCGISSGRARRGQYLYYRCQGTKAQRFGGKPVCNNAAVRADQLDEHVWRSVCEVLRDPERVLQEWSKRLADDEHTPLQAQYDEAKRIVEGLEANRKRLLDAYEAGLCSLDDLRTRTAPIQESLQRARADLAQAEAELTATVNLRAISTRLEDFAQQVEHGLEGLSREQRRDVIRMLVARVEIGAEKITIVFRVPRTRGPTEPPDSPTEPPTAPGRPAEIYGVRERRRGPICGVWGGAPSRPARGCRLCRALCRDKVASRPSAAPCPPGGHLQKYGDLLPICSALPN
jgi:site-specific DNA recombinase